MPSHKVVQKTYVSCYEKVELRCIAPYAVVNHIDEDTAQLAAGKIGHEKERRS